MPRSNVYALRNLSLPTKLTISLGVVSGFVLFLSGWIVSVVTINWGLSWMTLIDWGLRLGMLTSEVRWLLFALHGASLGLLLTLSLSLVRRMPLPRLTRRALFAVAGALAV